MKLDFDKPFTLDRIARIAIAILIAIALLSLLRMLSAVLIPFAVAMILAYLSNPFVNFIQHRLRVRNRVAAVVINTVGLLGITAVSALLFLPRIGREVQKFYKLLSKYTDPEHRREIISESNEARLKEFFSSEEFLSIFSREQLTALAERVLPEAWNIFNSSVNLLLGLLAFSIVVLYYIFILIDYENIKEGWKDLIPPKIKPPVIEVFEDLREGMSRYFRAQALVALLVGILFAVGFQLISLPLGILLGLFIGFLNLVPYLQIVGLIPSLFLAVLKAMESGQSVWVVMGMVLLVFTVVQLIQDVVLVPRIMGNTTGLQPAVILLALSVWGSLLGILGMIVALPLTTVLLSYYKRFISGNAVVAAVEESPPQSPSEHN